MGKKEAFLSGKTSQRKSLRIAKNLRQRRVSQFGKKQSKDKGRESVSRGAKDLAKSRFKGEEAQV